MQHNKKMNGISKKGCLLGILGDTRISLWFNSETLRSCFMNYQQTLFSI